MKSFLLGVFLAGASLAARAQTYYLDLSYQTLAVPNRIVAVEQVLDGRPGNPPVGIVYRGLGNQSAAVAFRNGVAADLTAFVRAQLPGQPTDHAIVLCVRSLHIGETINGTREQATAEMRADVYAHRPDGYHFVRSVGSHASAYGLETTGRHAGHVAQLLGDCLHQLSTVDWAAVDRQPARTLAELPADVPAPLAMAGKRGPAILREVPRRGFYFRLEQFLTNRPDTASTLVVDTVRRRFQSELAAAQWHLVARVRPLASNAVLHRKMPDGLWGFSDGQQTFVRHEKQFYPLTRQGNQFTFVGEAPVDQVHEAALSQKQQNRGMLFGVAGVVVARTSVPDHTAEPMAYGLDLRTGAIGPYPGPHATLRPDTAYVYVYQMPPSQSAANKAGGVVVVAEGREAGQLRPGQYLEVPWTRFGKPLRLCLTGLPLANSCLLLVPSTTQLNYLKLDATNPRQPWQWVSAAQGAADLDELDRLEKQSR